MVCVLYFYLKGYFVKILRNVSISKDIIEITCF
jgi:hypothetical protein